jgi:hypothetical protein
MKRVLSSLVALSLVTGGGLASAGRVSVYVGYADNLRPNPFFPNPWNGSPNTVFLGSTTPGTTFDAGAILIQNNSGGPINVNDVFVSGFDNGVTYDLWGTPGMLANNNFMILTQTNTNSSQFDSSDQLIGFSYPDSGPNGSPGGSGFTPSHPYTGDPQVKITINGVPTTFADTGHVLDTGGYDTATWPIAQPFFTPNNESLQWRPIGTTGVEDPGGNPPMPEPATLTMTALGAISFGAFRWRRRTARRPG